jgi:hypothetical protein
MKGRIALGAVVGIAATLIAVSTTRADPNLTNVGRHRHWIKTPDGTLVEVGPRLCDDPNLQRAFNQFHNNIHAVSPSGIGPVAPGLHNHTGAEIQASGC